MSCQHRMLVGAFVANVQARAKAYDVVQGRLTLPQLINNDFDETTLFKEAYDIIYKDMFDENGVLKDQVAKSMTGEIAMNMDMKVLITLQFWEIGFYH